MTDHAHRHTLSTLACRVYIWHHPHANAHFDRESCLCSSSSPDRRQRGPRHGCRVSPVAFAPELNGNAVEREQTGGQLPQYRLQNTGVDNLLCQYHQPHRRAGVQVQVQENRESRRPSLTNHHGRLYPVAVIPSLPSHGGDGMVHADRNPTL